MAKTRQRATRSPRRGQRPPTQPGLFVLGSRPGRPPVCDRYYQVEAVEALTAGLASGGRGQLRAACGTGKTHIALWTALDLVADGGLVVIAVPTIGLVAQTLAVWKTASGDLDALAVCGDRTVLPDGKGGEHDEPDDVLGDVEDIIDPVTTDPEVVASWLARSTRAGIRLLVVTHRSSPVVGEGLQLAGTTADLLIVDEAHRTAGAADKRSALIHDDEILPARRRLYMTATPRLFSAEDGGEKSAFSMNNPEVFGPVLYNYPFSRAIKDGYLDDYRVAVIGVTKAEVLDALRRKERSRRNAPRVTRAADTVDRDTIVQVAIARAAAELGLRRVIAFCPRLDASALFAATFDHTLRSLPAQLHPARPLTAVHVHGRMKHGERQHALDVLAMPPDDGWTVVSNARCLSEGIDVPSVDGIAFTAPKRSPIDIVQAVGRALRRSSDGSGVATIIVPVLLPDTAPGVDVELDHAIDAAEFEVLWEVVRALRSHDDVFASALDAARADGSFTGSALGKIDVSLPAGYESVGYLEHIRIHLVQAATSEWWDGYRELAAYYREFGTAFVRGKHVTTTGFNLSGWMENARRSYRRGTLAQDRVDALNRLGFVFDVAGHAWRTNLEAFTRFYDKYGHLDLPDDYESSLGTKVKKILAFYKTQQRQGKLAPERVEALERLGIVWDTNEEVRWQETVDFLRRYRAEHHHIAVPYDSDDPELERVSQWISARRRDRAGGKLTDPQIAELDELGFVWDWGRTQWERNLVVLRRHHAEHGTINFSADDARDDPAVARIRRLVLGLRSQHKRGVLPQYKVDDLTALGIRWLQTRPTWNDHYAEACRYREENGNVDIDYKHVSPSGLKMGYWLRRQQREHAAGRLAPAKVQRLEELGISWLEQRPEDQVWQQALARLDDHCRSRDTDPNGIRQNDVADDGYRIGTWIHNLRRRYARGQLSQRQERDLAARGVTPTVPRAPKPEPVAQHKPSAWDRQIAHLRTTFANGTAEGRGSNDMQRANNILYQLRRKHDAGQLTAEQIAALDEVLTDWQISVASTREKFALARGYVADHGHLLPPNSSDEDRERQLYAWVARQRILRSEGVLASWYIAKLDALGFVWDVPRANWDCGLAAAVEFHARTGHLRVSGEDTYLNPRRQPRFLQGFLQKQRDAYRAGTLDPERAAALDELGMDWHPELTQREIHLQALRAFRAENGHLRPLNSQRVNGVDVGRLVHEARQDYAAGRLSQDRIDAYNELGIDWDPRDVAWREMIDFLRGYHAKHGHLPVDASVRVQLSFTREGRKARNATPATSWLSAQRNRYAAGELTEAQIADLDALGIVWEKGKAVGARHFARLLAHAQNYHARHGHLDVPFREAAEHRELTVLYQWLRRMRLARQGGRLTDQQIADLDALGMTWARPDARTTLWMTRYEAVKTHLREHRNLPPMDSKGSSATPESALGRWLSYQRQQFWRGKLQPERAAMLAAIGVPFDRVEDTAWNAALARLADYRAQGNDPNQMPTGTRSADGFNLYHWLRRALRLASAGELGVEKVGDLVEHGVSVPRVNGAAG